MKPAPTANPASRKCGQARHAALGVMAAGRSCR